MAQTHDRLTAIPREECLELLSGSRVGRVAVPVFGTGPLVVPVNYVVDGEVIVFRSDYGTKVQALRQGPISFQVDFIDWYHRTGWSVLVRGIAYEATHWEVEHLDLEPWAGGEKAHWVRLVIDEITGRRIEPTDLSSGDDRGYL